MFGWQRSCWSRLAFIKYLLIVLTSICLDIPIVATGECGSPGASVPPPLSACADYDGSEPVCAHSYVVAEPLSVNYDVVETLSLNCNVAEPMSATYNGAEPAFIYKLR